MVLVQLAQEGFVNPKQVRVVRRLVQKHKQVRVVRRLVQKRLVRRNARLQLMNESFALFVKRVHKRASITRWERTLDGLGWQGIRWIVAAILLVIFVFLSVTQRTLFDSSLGFLPALAAAIPTTRAAPPDANCHEYRGIGRGRAANRLYLYPADSSCAAIHAQPARGHGFAGSGTSITRTAGCHRCKPVQERWLGSHDSRVISRE